METELEKIRIEEEALDAEEGKIYFVFYVPLFSTDKNNFFLAV